MRAIKVRPAAIGVRMRVKDKLRRTFSDATEVPVRRVMKSIGYPSFEAVHSPPKQYPQLPKVIPRPAISPLRYPTLFHTGEETEATMSRAIAARRANVPE